MRGTTSAKNQWDEDDFVNWVHIERWRVTPLFKKLWIIFNKDRPRFVRNTLWYTSLVLGLLMLTTLTVCGYIWAFTTPQGTVGRLALAALVTAGPTVVFMISAAVISERYHVS